LQKTEKAKLIFSDDIKLKKRPLFFYGAGFMCRRIVDSCALLGIRPDYISDRNPDLWGTSIYGIPIISPIEMKSHGQDNPIIITTLYTYSAENSLAEDGFTNVWCFQESLNQFYDKNTSEKAFVENGGSILYVKDCLADERSVEIVDQLMKYRLTGESGIFEQIFSDNEYYPRDIVELCENEVFVDGGSYDGDTILDFTKRTDCKFNHIYAFEPLPLMFNKINENLLFHTAIERITIINKALSDNIGVVRFTDRNVGSHVDENGVLEVETDFIDNLFNDKKDGPTYIKLDIEGAEMTALRGAEQTISSYRPKLAVCLYHRFNDLWEIPEYLMNKYSFYDYYIRHHSLSFISTVLYAIPKE